MIGRVPALYHYVGPPDLLAHVRPGWPVPSREALLALLGALPPVVRRKETDLRAEPKGSPSNPAIHNPPVTTPATLHPDRLEPGSPPWEWRGLLGQGAGEPFTFVVGADGVLRVAARRSEHVACAGGSPVLAAGEITFDPAGTVVDVSNQSTGYCPDLVSWQAVAAALDGAGIAHPGGFTHEVVFRRCPRCTEINVVRDGYFVCVFCESDLPAAWNIAT